MGGLSVPREGDYICTKDGHCGIVRATTPNPENTFQDPAGVELDVYTDKPWNGGERTNIGFSVPRSELDWITLVPINPKSVNVYTRWLKTIDCGSKATEWNGTETFDACMKEAGLYPDLNKKLF